MRFNIKPKIRRYTFVVVPEGTNPIVRFQLRTVTLAVVTASLIALAAFAICSYALSQHRADRIDSLSRQLTASSADLIEQLEHKDHTIDELQTELLGLSKQAKQVETQLIEIERLEAELKSLYGLREEPAGPDTASLQTLAGSNSGMGLGGLEQPVSPEDTTAILQDTKRRMTALLQQLPEQLAHLEETSAALSKQKELLRTTPTLWPTDSRRISSTFGLREDPFTGVLAFHSGLDIATNTGSPVYAAADGKVTDSGYDSARGNYVEIAHPSGIITIYMHLKSYDVQVNDQVSQGDQIGQVGSTGRSTGPHLHFEVVRNGNAVDPMPYLKLLGEEE